MYLLKRKKKGEGFTLIELLIVIVIIGILVAIALPNFQAAQNRAKTASLKSNIRSLGIVAQTYSVDWGGNVAENVNVLYNESTTKGYWKDFKNPFTGESGIGFAVANYAQSVTLISSLNKMRLACENCEVTTAAPVSSSGGIAAQDVFGDKPGMAAYLTDGEEFLLTGSVPIKVGTGVDFLKDPNGKVFALASSNKNKFALKSDASKSNSLLPTFLQKMVDALPQSWKDYISSQSDWWNKGGRENQLAMIKERNELLANTVATLSEEQKSKFGQMFDSWKNDWSKINDFQIQTMDKRMAWDKLHLDFEAQNITLNIEKEKTRFNLLKASETERNAIEQEINSACGTNYDQNACNQAYDKNNEYWQKIENDSSYQAIQQKISDSYNNFYSSDKYKSVESAMQKEVWNPESQLWSNMNQNPDYQNIYMYAYNATGNSDLWNIANGSIAYENDLKYQDAYSSAGGPKIGEAYAAMKAVYVYEMEKMTGETSGKYK